jgi:hypothetical protein
MLPGISGIVCWHALNYSYYLEFASLLLVQQLYGRGRDGVENGFLVLSLWVYGQSDHLWQVCAISWSGVMFLGNLEPQRGLSLQTGGINYI